MMYDVGQQFPGEWGIFILLGKRIEMSQVLHAAQSTGKQADHHGSAATLVDLHVLLDR